MTSTAILIDGAFFLARFRKVYADRDVNDARAVAKTAFSMAIEHIKALDRPKEALYRIFFYDCAPMDKRFQRPISGEWIDYSTSPMAGFRRDLHDQLRRQRKMALRLGRLADRGGEWQLKRHVYAPLHNADMEWEDLRDEHFELDMRQTQVDMKIGIDIASLAHKRLVDQIVLVAGDADFIPAAKLARREGIDFILDPMWQGISNDLHEHIDGLQSVCPRPY
ncbi:NYN domain-containing protein [Oleiagrimonas sp. C23AA]|uniref:NYN domain-containing protein n=1 Tax=Oleiagrimonas sp. C23AA TaxID=2719047 RepID=UPI00142163E2|nr:NYN domain-containing protein [Oleiagrimonas sp. C23AA]NII11271.1 NYN domain-containing protein [Oleiagrimonas sp. C23AA]